MNPVWDSRKMPGQISIRLSDETLGRLQILGVSRKVRRADLVREAIGIGLAHLEKGGPNQEILKAIDGLQRHLSKGLMSLPGQVRDGLLEVLELSDEDETTAAVSAPEPRPLLQKDEVVQPVSSVQEQAPESSEPESPSAPVDNGRRKEIQRLDLPIDQERRQSIRLARVLQFKAWEPVQLSDELSLELVLLERALTGQQELAATRVEARLVQWEYEMLRASWTPSLISETP